MRISDSGIAFIADWEGIRLKMYDDGGPGIGNATIGIGHLIHLGPIDGQISEAPFVNGITEAQAYDLFRVDVRRFEDVVNRLATVPLNQNQFDALVDFSFNTGGGYPAVWNAVNNGGDVAAVLAVTAILPAWATEALQRRRRAEGRLYNTPVAEEPEEDDMPSIRVWCAERSKTYLVAGTSAVPVQYPADDKELERLYGPHAMVLSAAQLDAMVAK